MLKALFFCGILTAALGYTGNEGTLWISQRKKADGAEKILTGLSWKRAAEAIFPPCSPIIITAFMKFSISGPEAAASC